MPSGTVTPTGGGGGSSAALFHMFGSLDTTVPGAGFAYLGWRSQSNTLFPDQAPNPFNLTDPTTPVVLASGNYTIAFEVECDETHAGKAVSIVLLLDTDGDDDGPGMTFNLEGGLGFQRETITCTRFLAAGKKIATSAFHNVGADLVLTPWAMVSWEAT